MDIKIDRDEFQPISTIANSIVSGLASERVWDGKKITENGVYAGVDIEKYHHDTELFDGFSISSTGLRTILKRPLEYWYSCPYNPNAEEPEATKALDFGKAAHMLLLGEDGFAERYVLRPAAYPDEKGNEKPWNANSNWCKAWLAAQAIDGKTVITETEISHIKRIAESLSRNEAVRLGILNGRIERSLFTNRDGIWLRNRPDVIPNASGDFVDLKTAASVDDDSISKAIYNHGYHIQAGFTRMVIRDVLGADAFTSFTFAFVEKAPPYDVRIVVLKDADIDLGERQAMLGLKILKECLKRNEWPGYDGHDQHISYVEMPAWGRSRIEDQIKLIERAA